MAYERVIPIEACRDCNYTIWTRDALLGAKITLWVPGKCISGNHVTEIYVNSKCKQVDLQKCIERTSKSVSLLTGY